MSIVRHCKECSRPFEVPFPSTRKKFCSRSCGATNWSSRRLGAINSNWRGGKASHPLYDSYNDMIGRCERPTHQRFADYGGRGVYVCDRWRADFWSFVEDMGSRPPGRSLDRIDNDGPYAPANCRWATAKEQRANRRPQKNWRVDAS